MQERGYAWWRSDGVVRHEHFCPAGFYKHRREADEDTTHKELLLSHRCLCHNLINNTLLERSQHHYL